MTISVQVTDPSGILSVVATVQKTDGGAGGDVSLAAVGGNTYSGQYSIPANQHTDGRSDTYTVSVKATDAVGNTSPTYAAGTVTVGPPDADDPVPPPPSFDMLPPAF